MIPTRRISVSGWMGAQHLVIWEVTRACALACVHCRADAIAKRHPLELTTEEGFGLIGTVRELAP